MRFQRPHVVQHPFAISESKDIGDQSRCSAEALRRAMLIYLHDASLPRTAYPALWGHLPWPGAIQ
jgi:hypothetical protein